MQKNEQKIIKITLNRDDYDNIISTDSSSNSCPQTPNMINSDSLKEPNETSKYRINFSVIIKEVSQNSNNKVSMIKNEFKLNLLLFSPEIDISSKLTCMSIMTYFYQESNREKIIYNFCNKYLRYMETEKGIDPFIFYRVFFRSAHFLDIDGNYFYSYKFFKTAETLLEKDPKSKPKFSQQLNEKIEMAEAKLKLMIEQANAIFEQNKLYGNITIENLKQIIDDIISKVHNNNKEKIISNNIETNNKENKYLYVINWLWLIKAKMFIEKYIAIKKDSINDNNNFKRELFNFDSVYCSYFNLKTNNKNNSSDVYPGPIDNYELCSFKDNWKEPTNLDENDFMKKGLNLNVDYVLLCKKDWEIFKNIFGCTNEIKRKPNSDLIEIKFLLLDKRINYHNNNINLLKEKYIQINKNSTIEELKKKINHLLYFNINFSSDYSAYKKKITNQNLACREVYFYIIDKKKKNILLEIVIAYLHEEISLYESLDIENIDLNNENNLDDLFNYYDKKNHVLIIETVANNDVNFIQREKSEEEGSSEYKCSSCDTKIKSIANAYRCELCHMGIYCNEGCSKNDKFHKLLHQKLTKYKTKKFILSDFLKIDLYYSLGNDMNIGRAGLFNLGNTCYLNSTIQCLSNTLDLTKYFLKDYYKNDINTGNNLGSSGQIADSYSNLIKEMWIGSYRPVNPRDFRINFIKNTKLFNNNEQQDSQEFLCCLLDRLHEDLNRITNKKYKELEEQKPDESDETASKRWWDYHKSREDSIIVDLFHGQYKSSIMCLTCGYTSTSYETYMYLGLPIPAKSTQIQFKFIKNNEYIGLNMQYNDNIKVKDIILKATEYLDKKQKLNDMIKMNDENNIFNYNNTEAPIEILYNCIEVVGFSKLKINRIFKTSYSNTNSTVKSLLIDNDKILNLYKTYKNEIVFYEKQNICNKDNEFVDIFVYPTTIKSSMFSVLGGGEKHLILSYPMLISVKKNMTLKELDKIIENKFSKLKAKKRSEDEMQQNKFIELNVPHFTEGWGDFQKKGCSICRQKCDNKVKYCSLFKYMKENDTVGELKDLLSNEVIILYAKSMSYNPKKKLYGNIDLLFEDKINFENLKKNVDIYDSLDLFRQKERLTKENSWRCPKCKMEREAEKSMNIYKLPYYLIVQFRRFKRGNAITRYITGNKNTTFINYPQDCLNLKDFVIGPDKNNAIYDLYGVILHDNFMDGGHYTAICKNYHLWIHYNDEGIKETDSIIQKDAYLLFYKRRKYE